MMSTARWGTAPNEGRAVLPPWGWSIRPPPGACGRVAGACETTWQCSLFNSSFCSAPCCSSPFCRVLTPPNPPQGTRAFRRAGPGGCSRPLPFPIFFGFFFWNPKMTPKVPKMTPNGLPNGGQNPPKIVKNGLRDPSRWRLRFWTPFWSGPGKAYVLQI